MRKHLIYILIIFLIILTGCNKNSTSNKEITPINNNENQTEITEPTTTTTI